LPFCTQEQNNLKIEERKKPLNLYTCSRNA
jgi:hypothetical protein